ncbi:MAG: polysaccharide deacetylase family protein [Candidatus Spechtbacterales bacterium]
MKKGDKICFISVDVEHDHGSEHAKTFHGAERMDEILDIFGREGISSTLFVTGEVLERYPDKIRKWAQNHEIGCHSYSHTFFDLVHVSHIREELERFVNLYKKTLSTAPKGFRAPSHIIDNAAIRTVSDAGFCYDSSVVPHYLPLKKYRGYLGGAPKTPYYPSEISYKKAGDMDLLELPVTGHLLGVPLAGAWIRGLPFSVYQFLFALHKPRYISFSFHSWDMFHDKRFTAKFSKMLDLLRKQGYQFKRGEEIANEYISKNRKQK